MKRDLPLLDEHLNQEVTITVRLRDALRLSEGAPLLLANPIPAETSASGLPPVGAEWHGGIYAGITLEGDHLAALILLPGDFKGKWAEAKEWAEKQEGVLPSRHDQLVLFRNLKSEFKQEWYWSGEQHADDSGCAWGQYFDYGGQDYGHVSSAGRARAVRRISIR